MRDVYKIVARNSNLSEERRLVSVTLQVGEMRDLVDNLVQTYWNYITENTFASGSKIIIHTVPVTCSCNQCERVYAVKIMEIDRLCCPQCGHDKASLLTGNELMVEEVEITTQKNRG